MPGLLQYRQDKEAELPRTRPIIPDNPGSGDTTRKSPRDEIEYADIWLQSKVDSTARRRVCREGLPRIEECLRTVQLEDSLENIRHILKVKTQMIQFKNKNIRRQKDGTRSRTIIDRVHQKAWAAAEKYRTAHIAKIALTGPGDWENTYKQLNDADIRGYQDPNCLRPRRAHRGIHEDDQLEDMAAQAAADTASTTVEHPLSHVELYTDERSRHDGTGETRRTLSWIWISESTNETDNDGIPDEEDPEDITRSDDILQVEWAKSRARAARWTEEVMLLKEEMRRTLAFLNWRADWWEKKPTCWAGVNVELEEGIRAYARSQGKSQRQLALHFAALWKNPLSEDDIFPGLNTMAFDDNDTNENCIEDDDDNSDDSDNEGGENGDGDNERDVDDEDNGTLDTANTIVTP